MRLLPLLPLLFATPSALAAPAPAPNPDPSLPAYFILVGDSTTAPQSPGGGGWGAGFLAALAPPATGANEARNGRTTADFRARGEWDAVLSAVKNAKSARKQPYVTVQFGHNDQKPEKGIGLATYRANLERMAAEVARAGGVPILVTPLTRRQFSGGKVKENLAAESRATLEAAERAGAWAVDLNRASTDYVNKAGPKTNDAYALKAGDNTHLNAQGSRVFGRLVADLLIAKYPETRKYFKEDAAVSKALKEGKIV